MDEPPLVSIVVLTRNEAEHIGACLEAIVAQSYPAIEVLVMDAASTDATVAIAKRYETREPERVRVFASEERLSIGEARNLGVSHARGEFVAFTSADAVAGPRWIEEAVRALARSDVVYGLQQHAPKAPTIGAVVRGLRYHHYAAGSTPETYASNVNCVGRRALFVELPFPEDPAASALDDVLFARDAQRAGHRIAFAPAAIVSHVDVSTLKEETTKVRREAYGWGVLRTSVGWRFDLLAWGGASIGFAIGALLFPNPVTAGLLLVALAAPALRRVARRGALYPRATVAIALLVSVALDVAYLVYYVKGLAAPSRSRGSNRKVTA